jgi:hypothetical protein
LGNSAGELGNSARELGKTLAESGKTSVELAKTSVLLPKKTGVLAAGINRLPWKPQSSGKMQPALAKGLSALISGGIDTFLEELIPNADQLFDFICFNRLSYDPKTQVITGVESTPFDFLGKTAALDAICKLYGCSLKEWKLRDEKFKGRAKNLRDG